MKDLFKAILNIFKYTGRIFTGIRNLLFNLIMIIAAVLIVVSLVPQTQQKIPNNSIVRLDIKGKIVEQRKIISSFEKFFEDSMGMNGRETETVLQDILDIINHAADDKRVDGLLLELNDLNHSGLNQLLTIGDALDNFKKRDKIIIASEDFYTQAQYLLASHATKLILNPMGAVDIHGFGVYRLYFKEAIEKLKIDYNIFKVGNYKSALEPFTRDSMSDEDRQQNELWLSSLWQEYIKVISQQRDLSIEFLNSYPDNIANSLQQTSGDAAQLALKSGLVDEIWTREEVNSYLEEKASKKQLITSNRYFDTITPSYSGDSQDNSMIGIIIAEGTILPGNQPVGLIGAESLGKLIKQARTDDQVKALVLRVNTGGGSAFASEIIRQELLETQKAGKPVIVSMGTVAASGGYWIAADADEIWASEVTITGSIGIFGAIPTFDKTLSDYGIYSDGTGTSSLAAGLDLTQPLPEQLKSAIQQNVNHNYNNFINLVASGRDMPPEKIEELAQGRVYDGVAAKNLGLVDELGSLADAVDSAAKLAKLDNFSATLIQLPTSVQAHLWQLLESSSAFFTGNKKLETEVGFSPLQKLQQRLLYDFKTYTQLHDPGSIFAFCPINLTI